MQNLSLIVFAIMVAVAQALTFSTLAQVSLTLMSLNAPAQAFFGMFRRRKPVQSMVEEQPFSPEGPVKFPTPSDFQQRSFFAGGNRFMTGFPSVPSFPGGMFQNNFQPFWPFMAPGNAPRPNPQFVPGPPEGSVPRPSAQFMPGPPETQHMFDSSAETGRDVRSDDEPTINTEEAESFFTLLAETDENKCISRLVCEMGADPSEGGELGSTISEIIGSLTDFPDGSKVSEYNQILQKGKTQGMSSCASQFSACDDESYMLMKNSQADPNMEATEST